MEKQSPTAPKGGKPALVPVLPLWSAVHTAHYHFLANQQNMLEDRERTGAYRAGMVANRADFEGKVVLDVGTGTGILAIFAAQAGARKVYAVEGSDTAANAKRLVEHNGLGDRIEVVHSTLEELELPEKADIVISEPWGFLLFHERMVEAFLIGRDRFMKKDGKVFPSTGRLWIAPFIDKKLHDARVNKRKFWEQKDFFGVDLTGLSSTASEELWSMPALGYVPPHMLMAGPACARFDFRTLPLDALAEIVVPFEFVFAHPGPVHGLCGWFDVSFDGSTERVLLTTAPDHPRTHWAPMRLLFAEPLDVRIGQKLVGQLVFRANPQSSYSLTFSAKLEGKPVPDRTFHLQGYFWWDRSD
jgi:histone-arginine methyltransferase CARM1